VPSVLPLRRSVWLVGEDDMQGLGRRRRWRRVLELLLYPLQLPPGAFRLLFHALCMLHRPTVRPCACMRSGIATWGANIHHTFAREPSTTHSV
jgi:hypothetical protein